MRDLASDSGVDFETFFAQGHEQDEPITIDKAIANAILKFLDPDWEMRRDGVVRKVEISADWHAHSGERRQRLDRAKTVQWMGMILLQVLSQKVDSASVGVGVGMEDFLSQWSDLLPEKWRGDVGLDRLGDGYYTIAREGLIMWVGEEAGLSVAEKDGLGAVNANATATAAVTGGKRKWHEKFKAQRKETRK